MSAADSPTDTPDQATTEGAADQQGDRQTDRQGARRTRRAQRNRDRADNTGQRLSYALAGVQKGGTSTLHALLQDHPQVARTRSKELHFFDRERIDWANPDYAPLHEKVRWRAGRIAGDATPRYIFWPRAMERIAAYNPAIRIVLSFRDPIDRAFSHWCMIKDREAAEPDFAASIREGDVTRSPRTAAEVGPPSRAFVTRGYYGEQLTRVLELFPAEQVLTLDYGRLFAELPANMAAITDFLGIERFAAVNDDVHLRAQPLALEAPPVTADDIGYLADLYAADLDVFAAISRLDISNWPTARVVRGDLSPADLAAKLTAKAGLTPVPHDAAAAADAADAS